MAAAAGVEPPVADRKAIVNFSRPRGNSRGDAIDEPGLGEATPSSVLQPSDTAHQPSSTSPYSSPDTESSNPGPSNPAGSEFAWDDRRGELISRRNGPQLTAQDQRHPGPGSRKYSSSNETSGSSNTTSSASKTAESIKQLMPKSILKQTQVEQYSERASSEAGGNAGSHHTVSDESSGGGGSGGSHDENGKWTSSDFDTSALSEKEVKKLEKKGVNPALYAEMKAAKSGKSCVGVLTANAYVS